MASLDQLPIETLLNIFSSLSGQDLAALSQICAHFHGICQDDRVWEALCPGLDNFKPYASYRQLYASLLHKYGWLLPAGLWVGNAQWKGSLLAIQYNYTTGEIDIHNVECVASFTSAQYSANPAAEVGNFTAVPLLSDKPILTLSSNSSAALDAANQRSANSLTSFFRCIRIVEPHDMIQRWPDPKLPSYGDWTRNLSRHPSRIDTPGSEASASLHTFRIHRRVLFRNVVEVFQGLFNGVSTALQTEVEYFARVIPESCIPSSDKPYQGIFIGDYSSHGPEFILVMMPTPTELKALKLTGDQNVPRAEFTFIVDDATQVTRICSEEEWPGATAVKARGQVASPLFEHSQWISTECSTREAIRDNANSSSDT